MANEIEVKIEKISTELRQAVADIKVQGTARTERIFGFKHEE